MHKQGAANNAKVGYAEPSEERPDCMSDKWLANGRCFGLKRHYLLTPAPSHETTPPCRHKKLYPSLSLVDDALCCAAELGVGII